MHFLSESKWNSQAVNNHTAIETSPLLAQAKIKLISLLLFFGKYGTCILPSIGY
jgi:hypothetical protein